MHRPDTSPDVQEVYDRMIGALSGEERFLRGISLTHFARELCRAGIRERSQSHDPLELKIRFFEVLYGYRMPPDEKKRIIDWMKNASMNL